MSTFGRAEVVEKDMYAGGSKFRMVLIAPGKYWMGSPEDEKDRDSYEKQHKVIISKAFWIGKYEVTQKQWNEVTGEKQWSGESYMEEKESNAAAYISWEDVEGKFLKKLGKGYNFPTEGQWEYACRGGTSGRFYWGESESAMGEYANVADRTAKGKYSSWTVLDVNDGYAEIAPVGSFKGNGYGLHDMTGNVYEWCRDWKGDYAIGEERDPIGANNGTNRVGRGGSWEQWVVVLTLGYSR